MSSPTFSRVYRTNAGVVIDGVRHPDAISPARACIFGAVAATYTGGTSRGASASSERAGTEALHVSPSYSNGPPPSTPRTIATASRIGPSVRRPSSFALLRKIFDVPRPSRKRAGPAASWTTRASIATCTGCRVNGEMIPQPTVIRSVARATSAEVTVDERASIPCLRHQGYASASQIVSISASSMTRAEASISSSGSIVSCMTPIRKGWLMAPILSRCPAEDRGLKSHVRRVCPNRRNEPAELVLVEAAIRTLLHADAQMIRKQRGRPLAGNVTVQLVADRKVTTILGRIKRVGIARELPVCDDGPCRRHVEDDWLSMVEKRPRWRPIARTRAMSTRYMRSPAY